VPGGAVQRNHQKGQNSPCPSNQDQAEAETLSGGDLGEAFLRRLDYQRVRDVGVEA